MKVNIYIASSIKALKPSNGVVGYVIETQTSKGPATLTQFGTVKEVSKNAAEILALKNALSRINIKCELDLWSENRYICSVFSQGWLKNWETTGFLKGNGEEVVDAEIWREVACLLNGRGILTHPQEEHEYKGYLEREVERRAKKYV